MQLARSVELSYYNCIRKGRMKWSFEFVNEFLSNDLDAVKVVCVCNSSTGINMPL